MLSVARQHTAAILAWFLKSGLDTLTNIPKSPQYSVVRSITSLLLRRGSTYPCSILPAVYPTSRDSSLPMWTSSP